MRLCVKITRNEAGGYTALCPTLPGCTSRGKTPREARDHLDEAIRGYMGAMNNFVPEHVDHEVVETWSA